MRSVSVSSGEDLLVLPLTLCLRCLALLANAANNASASPSLSFSSASTTPSLVAAIQTAVRPLLQPLSQHVTVQLAALHDVSPVEPPLPSGQAPGSTITFASIASSTTPCAVSAEVMTKAGGVAAPPVHTFSTTPSAALIQSSVTAAAAASVANVDGKDSNDTVACGEDTETEAEAGMGASKRHARARVGLAVYKQLLKDILGGSSARGKKD
jgi:hypothetical protein